MGCINLMFPTFEISKEICNKKYSCLTNNKPYNINNKIFRSDFRPRDTFRTLLHGKWSRGIILSKLWNPSSDIRILNIISNHT